MCESSRIALNDCLIKIKGPIEQLHLITVMKDERISGNQDLKIKI